MKSPAQGQATGLEIESASCPMIIHSTPLPQGILWTAVVPKEETRYNYQHRKT